MAITKIIAGKGSIQAAVAYILNDKKTDNRILTATLNCEPGHEVQQMLDTKARFPGKSDGVQYYHIIQSFRPGEITPKIALEVAKKFAEEYLSGFEVVIGTHIDRDHIHSHLIFNAVNLETGKKFHSNTKSYYQGVRAASDKLCREYGLSVLEQSKCSVKLNYAEWLRQSKGQQTFRSMLEEDLKNAIQDANDLGHFFMLMEHKGYEISYGKTLGFKLRGQQHFMRPGRRNPMFTEEGICAAIRGNLEQIEAGLQPAIRKKVTYKQYQKHLKYKGFMALYVHYLYILGKIQKHEYPSKLTPRMRKAAMDFEQYKVRFEFLRENNIATSEDIAAFQNSTEKELNVLIKQRTILNVRKKKRRKLYDALADVEVLRTVKGFHEKGLSGMEYEFLRYTEAVKMLDHCGIPLTQITAEKVEIYNQLAEINREIRQLRRKLELCKKIEAEVPQIKSDIQKIENKEVGKDECRRRRSR
jgi:hypothetical protein